MGGANSTLSAEQSAEITRKLKESYEICKADGLEDEIIQSTLQSDYKRLVEAYKVASTTTSGLSVLETNVSTKNAKSSPQKEHLNKQTARQQTTTTKEPNSAKPKPSRRRSFDSSSARKAGKEADVLAAAAAAKLVESASLSSLLTEDPVVPEVVDSWDSVTQQPFCKVCQMAFKSMAFLDRHVKYSDLHAKNVLKSSQTESDGTASTQLTSPVAEDLNASPDRVTSLAAKFNPKQVEGVDYKLLYTGSKFFWRNQRTVVLDLYLHILCQTIEVIAFDSDKHKEMNRLYLAADVLDDIAWKAIAEEHANKVRDLRLADRFAEVDEEKLKSEMKLNKTISYILSRIQLGFGADKLNTVTIIEFAKLHGDDYSKRNPVLDQPPIVLIPIGITRRRRTNAQEIEATISGLSLDISRMSGDIEKARHLSKEGGHMVKASGAAQRIAEHVYNAVNWFSKKKRTNSSALSPMRLKWLKAGRRVIRQSLVKRTTEHLKAKNIPYIATPVASPVKRRTTIRRATEL